MNTSKLSINSLDSLRFRLYGQQCKRSEGCDNEEFQNPKWYREEVEKVLNNVHKKIGEVGGLNVMFINCYILWVLVRLDTNSTLYSRFILSPVWWFVHEYFKISLKVGR